MAVEFVRIKDTKKPGDYLVLAKRDFVEGVHELFEAPAATASDEPSGTRSVENLHDLNAADAKALVETVDDVPLLQGWLEAEKAHPKYEGGRKSVIDAIEAKLHPKG